MVRPILIHRGFIVESRIGYLKKRLKQILLVIQATHSTHPRKVLDINLRKNQSILTAHGIMTHIRRFQPTWSYKLHCDITTQLSPLFFFSFFYFFCFESNLETQINDKVNKLLHSCKYNYPWSLANSLGQKTKVGYAILLLHVTNFPLRRLSSIHHWELSPLRRL